MTSSISSASGRSPITLAAGFLGAFIVGSLAVQLVRSQSASVQAGAHWRGAGNRRACRSLGSLGRARHRQCQHSRNGPTHCCHPARR